MFVKLKPHRVMPITKYQLSEINFWKEKRRRKLCRNGIFLTADIRLQSLQAFGKHKETEITV
jgi:hypothetical protein